MSQPTLEQRLDLLEQHTTESHNAIKLRLEVLHAALDKLCERLTATEQRAYGILPEDQTSLCERLTATEQRAYGILPEDQTS